MQGAIGKKSMQVTLCKACLLGIFNVQFNILHTLINMNNAHK